MSCKDSETMMGRRVLVEGDKARDCVAMEDLSEEVTFEQIQMT